MIIRLAGTLFALALFANGAGAADLAVTGQVEKPLQLTDANLKSLPATDVTVSYTIGHHGEQHGTFKGVLLWTLLGQAGVKDGAAKGAHLQHGILVSGSDGYSVLVAMGEIDPEIEGKAVILAYAKDGKPIGLKLVVPGDHKGARAVFDVVRVEIQ